MLHAELRVDLEADPGSEPTRVLAHCAGERLGLQVSDPVSRKVLRRNFALREPQHPGMSRLVGIAAAELVLASWAELSLNPEPRVEPLEPRPPAATLEAARSRVARSAPPRVAVRAGESLAPPERAPSLAELPPDDTDSSSRTRSEPLALEGTQFRVLALVSRRAFFSRPGALWGGGVRAGSEPLALTSWAADTLFESGEVELREGTRSLQTWTLGGQLFVYGRLPPVTFRLGGGLRAGLSVSSESGDSDGGTSAVAPWGWPLLTANVSVRAAERFVFEVSAEASYVVLPISSEATGETLRGTWFSTQLGVGLLP